MSGADIGDLRIVEKLLTESYERLNGAITMLFEAGDEDCKQVELVRTHLLSARVKIRARLKAAEGKR